MKLADLINQAIAQHGGKVIADAAGIDPPRLSRFRSGEVGLTLSQLEAIFKFSDYTLTTVRRQAELKNTIVTVVELLREEMKQ